MPINYSECQPGEPLKAFIFSFWKTQNNSGTDIHYTVVPDAGIELIISIQPDKPNRIDLFGLSTHILDITIPNQAVFYGIRFKLLAVEYLLKMTLETNSIQKPPIHFEQIDLQAETSLDSFVDTISTHLHQQLQSVIIDSRKQKLLDLVYHSKGTISVHNLALETGWAARQINRYFTGTFGLSLKAYLEQLAFFSSLPQIGQGDFYPQEHYYDQSHFIRQTKKHTGNTPKQLYLQRYIRFVQLGHYSEE
ncbi:AraC family transcriptional regulator [Cytophagaceae bacterium YF14B1]|uniref:AraC family transcriptional regulator n=1 Tax=Xanthocytophaga flava TaxID=3048013 RepID=A0AAE3U880_9BACT|nr:AraC family transcriptional regulator [Xanthocytophaga flavus]MDJ1480918.1 AraC family transcriptional regulator [Xanthocytophaga flavus]